MKCPMCQVDKLSNEFPPTTLTEQCDHPALSCLRCVIAHVEAKKSCPHPGCPEAVPLDCQNIKWFKAILTAMFTEYETTYTPPVVSPGAGAGIITITVLNGETTQVPFASTKTVLQLKTEICQKLKHEVNKQKLLYNDKEIQIYKPDGQHARLCDYNVQPMSTIYLVVLLYSIPEAFDHVVFDLYWGYPVSGQDYLDASCLLFQGTQFVNVCDYSNRNRQAVSHSGDVMDHRNRKGHHTIHVYLKQIPSNITHLFFTLSAWNSPNISRYPNPSLKFYEASKPTKDLCKTTFNHARSSQAVVMCSLSRSTGGIWQIFESGKLSAGNAKNYSYLQDTIRTLIMQGF